MFIGTPYVPASKRAANGYETLAQERGRPLLELVVIGFSEKHRALEVLPQLQRLEYEWCADLNEAVAVEVERDGRLRLVHSDLLDPAAGWREASQWKALLSAIIPLPHIPNSSRGSLVSEVRSINAEANAWREDFALDQDFVRDAAALLQPGNSAIFATLREWKPALKEFSHYSPFVLHTRITSPDVEPKCSLKGCE